MLASEKDIGDFTQDNENQPWISQRGGASTEIPLSADWREFFL